MKIEDLSQEEIALVEKTFKKLTEDCKPALNLASLLLQRKLNDKETTLLCFAGLQFFELVIECHEDFLKDETFLLIRNNTFEKVRKTFPSLSEEAINEITHELLDDICTSRIKALKGGKNEL